MVNRETINCEQVWKEISNYIEGDVAPAMRIAMDDHFHACQRCRSVLEGTQNVLRLYRDERMIDVPSGFGRRLEKRLTQNVRAQRRNWSTWSAWLIPVAALALFAGGLRWANSSTGAHPLRSEHAQQGTHIPPDMKVVVSEGARDFHVPGCDLIHNKDKERTLTAREAIREGYVPCVRCMRKYLQTASNENASPDLRVSVEADFDDDRSSHSR